MHYIWTAQFAVDSHWMRA